MKNEEMKAKLEELKGKIKVFSEMANNKINDDIDQVLLKNMETKEKVNEKIKEHKGYLNSLKENMRMSSNRAKSKISAELLKAQMNIEVAKEKLAAEKEAYDKFKMEEYINDTLEYAEACVALANLAEEEANLAILEAIDASIEYDEKYGNEE